MEEPVGINLFRDLGFDENSTEVRRAREEAAIYAQSIAGLVAARKGEKLSQAQVAERMGTTQSAVSEIEAGRKDVRLSTLIRYAQAVQRTLGVTMASRDKSADPIWEHVAEVRSIPQSPASMVKVRFDANLLASFDESDLLFKGTNSRRYEFGKAA
jgi:transcriptional regulator with XRE-family HTH domain